MVEIEEVSPLVPLNRVAPSGVTSVAQVFEFTELFVGRCWAPVSNFIICPSLLVSDLDGRLPYGEALKTTLRRLRLPSGYSIVSSRLNRSMLTISS